MDSGVSPGPWEELDLAAMVGDGEDPSSADLYPEPNILALKE